MRRCPLLCTAGCSGSFYGCLGRGPGLSGAQLFGMLTAISIVGALYGELVIFPIVLERFDRQVVSAAPIEKGFRASFAASAS